MIYLRIISNIYSIDHHNIPLLLKYQVQFAAGVAFQLGRFNDREIYPVVLPILSLLVNYGNPINIHPHTCSYPLFLHS